jgi:pimeloyl-ACP methyl ester carboxylesterase
LYRLLAVKERATTRRSWRIGELAAATGLTVRTLHHYEHFDDAVPRSGARQPSQGAQDMLNEQIAKDVGPAHLDIAWEERGDPLVLHGLADTLCDPSGGRATAAAIPGAELVLIDGMGHNLPPGLWERIADHVVAVVRKGEVTWPRPSYASESRTHAARR